MPSDSPAVESVMSDVYQLWNVRGQTFAGCGTCDVRRVPLWSVERDVTIIPAVERVTSQLYRLWNCDVRRVRRGGCDGDADDDDVVSM